MNNLEIILSTIATLMLAEGSVIAIWPKSTAKTIKKIFKNKREVMKVGLIEMILGLIILFIISL